MSIIIRITKSKGIKYDRDAKYDNCHSFTPSCILLGPHSVQIRKFVVIQNMVLEVTHFLANILFKMNFLIFFYFQNNNE